MKGRNLNLDTLSETKFLMKKYNIKANKSLGQNFLIDGDIISNIVKSAEIGKDDAVIEIGPGLGTLTNEIAKFAKKVICVELDKKMVQILQDRFYLFDNVEIINEDILKLDLNKIIEKEKKNIKIVANLPYYITTPIIMKLLEDRLNIDSITVMVQKEVADRLCAKTGTREAGAITYSIEYYTTPQKLFTVPNTSFIPMPNVESEVINLKIKKEKKEEVIKYAFMQRRKTLLNALQNTDIGKDKEHVKEVLEKLNIDEKIRGEALTLKEFIDISNLI